MHKIFFIVFICYCSFSTAQTAIDSSLILLKNVNILNYQTDDFQKGDLFIEDGKIKNIQYGQSITPPKDVLIYDLENQFLIPGLIDAHVHFGTDPSFSDNLIDTKKKLEYLLHHGVTTVRDMAGDTRYLSYLSRIASLDEIPSPDIYYSSLMAGASFFRDPRTKLSARGVDSGNCAWMKAVDLTTDMSIAIAEAKGTGATGIKIYADLDAPVIEKIVQAAHQQNMKVWAHASVFPAKPSEICNAQVDVISHATLMAWEGAEEIPNNASERYKVQAGFNLDHPKYDSLMKLMKKNKVMLDATVAVFDRERLDISIYQQGIDLTKLAYKNQVKIGVGTDMLINDFPETAPILKEMKILIDAVGMSPLDVLKSATIINAEMIGQEDRIGSIEMGKQANLVILKNNPLTNIENCGSINFVLKNGKVIQE